MLKFKVNIKGFALLFGTRKIMHIERIIDIENRFNFLHINFPVKKSLIYQPEPRVLLLYLIQDGVFYSLVGIKLLINHDMKYQNFETRQNKIERYGLRDGWCRVKFQ